MLIQDSIQFSYMKYKKRKDNPFSVQQLVTDWTTEVRFPAWAGIQIASEGLPESCRMGTGGNNNWSPAWSYTSTPLHICKA
jgi:hypothetical protein